MEQYYSGKVESYGKTNNDSTNLTHMLQEEKISEDFDEKPFIFEVESTSTKKGGNDTKKQKSRKEYLELTTAVSKSEYEGGGRSQRIKKQPKKEWDLDDKKSDDSNDDEASEDSGSANSSSGEGEEDKDEDNDSEESESKTEENIEGWQQLEGVTKPYQTEIARQFISGLMVG